MNGVAAMVTVLTGNAMLTAQVPAARIMPGVAPQGTALPHIAIMRVSATDLNIPAPANKRFVRELVQVNVLARDYRQLQDILALVKRAGADKLWTPVDGISSVTVHTAGTGPDFMDEEATIYIGSQDFTVHFNEDR